MRNINSLKIFKLLTLGIVVLLVFFIKKNNASEQKVSNHGFISSAHAETPEGTGGLEGCGYEGASEGAAEGCDGCY